MNIYIQQPFTYFMFWKKHNKRYYGCRFSKTCAPIDVLSGRYRSSSKYVKHFWDSYGPPDCIVIHRVFNSTKECRDFESEYLSKVNAAKSGMWLNMSDNKSIAPECSGGAKAVKFSHASRKRHMETDPEFAQHIRDLAIKHFTSESANNKRKETFKINKHSQGEKNPRFGIKVKGTETAKRISNARKQQVEQNKKAAELLNIKNKTCEYCGMGNLSVGNYKRWHHTNCKFFKIPQTNLHSTGDGLFDELH